LHFSLTSFLAIYYACNIFSKEKTLAVLKKTLVLKREKMTKTVANRAIGNVRLKSK